MFQRQVRASFPAIIRLRKPIDNSLHVVNATLRQRGADGARFTVHCSSLYAQGEFRVMVTLRKVIPALCLATSLAGVAAYAQTATTTAAATASPKSGSGTAKTAASATAEWALRAASISAG